jgi:putative ABC transport system substrate-binding protein
MKTKLLWLLAVLLLACFHISEAQQPGKVHRIGAFLPASASSTAHLLEAFREGLREQGYVGKKNLILEPRYAEGSFERLAILAADLVRSKVDVIVVGSTPGAMATKNATGTIPIVIVTTGDPVASALIATLAHPGGNITGVTALGQELSGKRLEILKEAVPKISRVAVLANPANPDTELSLKGMEVPARALGVQLRVSFESMKSEIQPSSRTLSRPSPAREPGRSWCCQTDVRQSASKNCGAFGQEPVANNVRTQGICGY